MVSEKKFSHLLDSLYGAAGDENAWQLFLVELVSLIKAQTSVLLAYDGRHVSYSVNASVGVSPDANALYNCHYGKMDEWYLGGRKTFEPNLFARFFELWVSFWHNDTVRPLFRRR